MKRTQRAFGAIGLALVFAALVATAVPAHAQLDNFLRRARERVEDLKQEVEEIRDDTEDVVTDAGASAVGAVEEAAGAVAAELPASVSQPSAASLDVTTTSRIGSEGIAGAWVGAMPAGPGYVQLALDLKSPDATGFMEGTARIEPVQGQLTGGGTPIGVAPVRVRYDAAAQTATLLFGMEAARIQLRTREMLGFVDADRAIIAGVFRELGSTTSSLFVLARPADAGNVVLNRLPPPITTQRNYTPVNPGEEYSRDVLFRWAQRFVDEYADTDAYRTQGGQLGPMTFRLFTDKHFRSHFGVTYDQLSDQDRARVAAALRTVPRPRANFPEERVNGVLAAVDRPFLFNGSAEIKFAVLALRYVEAWKAAASARMQALGGSPDAFRVAAAIETSATSLDEFVWPSDAEAFRASLRGGVERLAGSSLEDEVDRLLARATGVAGALELHDALSIQAGPTQAQAEAAAREAGNLRIPGLFAIQNQGPVGLAELARNAPETWAVQRPRIDARANALLNEIYAAASTELGLGGAGGADPVAQLRKTRSWFDTNRRLLDVFNGKPAMSQFLRTLGAQREANYAAALPKLSADLQATRTRAEAQYFGDDLYVDLDETQSATWRTLEQQRNARVVALDREAFAARVGEGPFGVDHPGAVYLNALWRNDLKTMAEEDRAVIGPVSGLMLEFTGTMGIDSLAAALSGGVLKPGDYSEMIAAEARNYSIAQPLAGFFIIAYERVYPRCMDANPAKFTHTVVWETVVKNGFGAELYRYPSGSSTTEYNINQRHVAAFNEVGLQSGPEEIDFTTSLFGAFLPSDVTRPLRTVSETLRGLRMAMTNNACDSPVIQQLERNMLQRVTGD